MYRAKKFNDGKLVVIVSSWTRNAVQHFAHKVYEQFGSCADVEVRRIRRRSFRINCLDRNQVVETGTYVLGVRTDFLFLDLVAPMTPNMFYITRGHFKSRSIRKDAQQDTKVIIK